MTDDPKATVSAEHIHASPMSYEGFTKRLGSWLHRPRPLGASVFAWIGGVIAAAVMWFGVLPIWYLIFVFLLGAITVPYRVIRRGAREEQELAEKRHANVQALFPKRPPGEREHGPRPASSPPSGTETDREADPGEPRSA